MSIKGKVTIQYLAPIILLYIGVVTALSGGNSLSWDLVLNKTAPTAVLCIFCGLVQDFVPRTWKEILVFWSLQHQLPGHRAYTEVCSLDTRISAEYLYNIRVNNPMDASSQNSLWYKQYKKVSDLPQVLHENTRYIAWRDTAVLLSLLTLLSVVLCSTSFLGKWDGIGLILFLLAGTFASMQAAENAAESLVRNVVAIIAAQDI